MSGTILAVEPRETKKGSPYWRVNFEKDGRKIWASTFDPKIGGAVKIGADMEIETKMEGDFVTIVSAASSRGASPSKSTASSREAHISKAVALKAAVDYAVTLPDADRSLEAILIVADKFNVWLNETEEPEPPEPK